MEITPTETKRFLNLEPAKQDRILEAAIHEFSVNGYARASVNTVVKRAGISKGSLFKYFESKSGLFAFVYRLALRRVKDYLRAVRDSSEENDFFERVEKIMKAGVIFIREHPDLARIYYHIMYTGDSPYRNGIIAEIQGESRRFLQALVEHGIRRKEIRQNLDPGTAAFFVECVLDRFLQSHYLHFLDTPANPGPLQDSESRRWVGEILALFRDGMKNRPQPSE